MAVYLAVANFDETEKYDFTLAASKVRYISGSMSDTTSELGEPVELRFQTVTKGTEIQIRESLRDVERIFARASQFLLNLTSQQSIWIYVNSDGERKRRALVLSWQRVDTVQGSSDPLLDKSLMVISDWIITRKGYWEATLTNIYSPALGWSLLRSGAAQTGAFTGTGVAITTSSTVIDKGTAPGRIRNFRFSWPVVYTNKYLGKMWLGMKTVKTLDSSPSYFKPFATFDNVWGGPDIYDSWINRNFTTGMTGIALNDNCVDIEFDGAGRTPGWKNRISTPVPYHGTAPDNQAGTYQILFRMRASDSDGSFRVAMFQAWDLMDQNYAVAETYQDVFVESDEFHLYEMGVVQVPPENFRSARRVSQDDFYQLNIGIAAETLIPGNGTLQIDYMIWIPQEHSLSLSNVRSKVATGCEVITDEEDVIFGATTAWGTVWEKFVHEVSANNWTFPSDPDRRLITVVAADVPNGSGHHPLHEIMTVTDFKVIPRYQSYNTDSY